MEVKITWHSARWSMLTDFKMLCGYLQEILADPHGEPVDIIAWQPDEMDAHDWRHPTLGQPAWVLYTNEGSSGFTEYLYPNPDEANYISSEALTGFTWENE